MTYYIATVTKFVVGCVLHKGNSIIAAVCFQSFFGNIQQRPEEISFQWQHSSGTMEAATADEVSQNRFSLIIFMMGSHDVFIPQTAKKFIAQFSTSLFDSNFILRGISRDIGLLSVKRNSLLRTKTPYHIGFSFRFFAQTVIEMGNAEVFHGEFCCHHMKHRHGVRPSGNTQ